MALSGRLLWLFKKESAGESRCLVQALHFPGPDGPQLICEIVASNVESQRSLSWKGPVRRFDAIAEFSDAVLTGAAASEIFASGLLINKEKYAEILSHEGDECSITFTTTLSRATGSGSQDPVSPAFSLSPSTASTTGAQEVSELGWIVPR